MKTALVSPCDFAYPGGVVNHISALGHQFTKQGHQVKVIAPSSRAVSHFGGQLKAREHNWENIARSLLNYYLRVLGATQLECRFLQEDINLLSVR